MKPLNNKTEIYKITLTEDSKSFLKSLEEATSLYLPHKNKRSKLIINTNYFILILI